MAEAVSRAYDRDAPKEIKSMKRKVAGVVLISRGLGLFCQALAQGLDCQSLCREKYIQCRDLANKSADPIGSLRVCNDAYHNCVGNCVNTRNPL
jgi:hypothetical protein